MNRTTNVAVVLLLASAGAPTWGYAQDAEPERPEVAEARTRFELAERHFDSGDYALALTEFERVHELMTAAGHPNTSYVLYNIALTNERMGRDAAAVEAYERFLAETGDDAPNRADARNRLRELRARVALEERDRGAASPSGDGGGGGGGVSTVGIVVAATGGAAAIVGGIFGGLALSNSESARAECVDMRCPESARDGIADAQTLANVADGLLFGGLAVAATGVVLMFVLDEGGGGDAQASAACTGDGCVAVVAGRF